MSIFCGMSMESKKENGLPFSVSNKQFFTWISRKDKRLETLFHELF